MTIQELAESVRRWRDEYNHRCPALEMEVIETLVQLVGEMQSVLQQCDEAMGYMSEYDIPLCLPDRVKSAATKSGTFLAQLAKGEQHG